MYVHNWKFFSLEFEQSPTKGYFPLGDIFRAERNFSSVWLSWVQSSKTNQKENSTPRGKFRVVENSL